MFLNKRPQKKDILIINLFAVIEGNFRLIISLLIKKLRRWAVLIFYLDNQYFV